MPPVTARSKTSPEMPVPPVTARKKHMVTNALSVPPWRLFGCPIGLLIIRANKPIRICFLRIVLENSRGPRKKVFRLDSFMRSKCTRKSWRSTALVYKLSRPCFSFGTQNIPSLELKMKRRNTDQFLSGSKMENHGI